MWRLNQESLRAHHGQAVKLFSERLGEQVANELVDWFNQVDATYRADLRDLNDRNFALFDAKLDQRFAKVDERFAVFEAKVDQRFAKVDERFAKVDERFARIEERMLTKDAETRMLRWMIAMWMTTILAIVLK